MLVTELHMAKVFCNPSHFTHTAPWLIQTTTCPNTKSTDTYYIKSPTAKTITTLTNKHTHSATSAGLQHTIRSYIICMIIPDHVVALPL